MIDIDQWPTTTPRSAHVGQPGYDNKENWQHYFTKYHERLLRFGRRHYPKHRWLVEDVAQNMYHKVLTNPYLLAYDPDETHFRSVLIRVFRITFTDTLRKMKEQAAKNYISNTAPFRAEASTQECDRRRLQLLTVSMIEENLMRPDYPNGRFSREINSLDLLIWRALQEPGATYMKVARALNQSLRRVFTANHRVQKRIVEDARALLASLELI